MSGFAAVLGLDEGGAGEVLLHRISAPLELHGPDGTGIARDGPVGLAHALFATRTGATLGPHRSERGVALVGDIRIDAQLELRRALAAAGISAAPDAHDDALVLAAWDAWGEDAPSWLRGDFSFALWDPGRRVLLCARDGLGVRPLFYAQVGESFVCSNVLASVRAHPRVSSRLHAPAIVSFLASGYNADLTTTSFADVRRLAPGHQLLLSPRASCSGPRRHWSFPTPEPLVFAREEEYVERYRAVLGDAVRDRLRVPRAAILLSGGLDSTSLAATARRVAPDVSIDAYTVVVNSVLPDDEGRIAAEVARMLGVSHEVIDDVPLPLDWLDNECRRPPEPLDEPGQSANYRTWSRIASRARILIYGEDGDTLFRPPGLLTMLRTWPALDVATRIARYIGTHRRHPHTGLRLRGRLRALLQRRRVAVPDWIRSDAPGISEHLATKAPLARHGSRPEAHAGLTSPLWQSLLEVSDAAYSGVALEVRWPFLDPRVLEFAFSIPPVPWCQRKELVRVAFRGELPREVLSRPKTPLRGYHEIQVGRWRATAAARTRVLSARVADFIDADCLRGILEHGSSIEVSGAWRAFELDRWLRDP